jgi:osmotically-inducible protein OsmY
MHGRRLTWTSRTVPESSLPMLLVRVGWIVPLAETRSVRSPRDASVAEKWNAERAAERVSGVRALTVSMDVELEASSARNDVDIARAVDNMLQWTTSLPKDQVKIMVEGGWLTLTGKFDWEFQRQTAADAVRNLIGVRGITNSLTIDSNVSASSVKSDIEAALKRRAATDARKISVTVRDANVTLSGTVGSWSERELATHSAWGTSGVRSSSTT